MTNSSQKKPIIEVLEGSRNNFEDNRLPQSGCCIVNITMQPAIHAKFNLQYRIINYFEFVGNIFKDIQQKQTTLHFYSNSFALQTLRTNFDTCTYLQSRNFLHKYFIEVDIVFFAANLFNLSANHSQKLLNFLFKILKRFMQMLDSLCLCSSFVKSHRVQI